MWQIDVVRQDRGVWSERGRCGLRQGEPSNMVCSEERLTGPSAGLYGAGAVWDCFCDELAGNAWASLCASARVEGGETRARSRSFSRSSSSSSSSSLDLTASIRASIQSKMRPTVISPLCALCSEGAMPPAETPCWTMIMRSWQAAA